MRKTRMAAAAGLVASGVVAGLMIGAAVAQPAPGAGPGPGPDGRPGMMAEHPGPHGWFHHGPWGGRGPEGGPQGMMERLRTFALIYPAKDRHLSTDDVQKIAEAFLLWNGNHDWKVVDVTQAPDNKVAFALATKEGSVVARFTMNQRNGRVERTG
jgi:hypothetical protein